MTLIQNCTSNAISSSGFFSESRITVTLPRATTKWLFALRISFYLLLVLFTFNLPTNPNTNLAEVGKLCLAAIFQEPGKSKNTPSESYNNLKYYTPIFKNNHPEHIASICAELLYMDYYFDKIFRPKFNRENKNLPDSANKINFANNARRICVAFTALAARYHQGNITDKDVTALTLPQTDSSYKKMRNLGEMKNLLPIKLNTEAYNAALDRLFTAIIEEGATAYSYAREGTPTLNETNFLKSDKNYYAVLQKRWSTLRRAINEIFQGG